MKKSPLLSLVFGILFLLLIQSAGTLVESIYIQDLLHTKMDEKVLGVLFFFSPLLLLLFSKQRPNRVAWVLTGILLLTRGLTPYLDTSSRILASGLATGAALSLFFMLLAARVRNDARHQAGLAGASGLALAVGLSTLLRTVNFGVEYSLTPAGGWVGWLLGLALGGLLTRLEFIPASAPPRTGERVTIPLVGVYLLITLVYFVFSAPAVIVRWTESDYTAVVSAVSLLSLGFFGLALYRPRLLDQLSPRFLLGWNILFTISLTGTLLAQRVSFPPALGAPEVVVSSPAWWQHIPLVLMLVLFPVIFMDMRAFLNRLERSAPTPSRLVAGILIGGFSLILLVFSHIFTNVWGYIRPVSLWFRNLFWLPHFLLAAGACLALWFTQRRQFEPSPGVSGAFHWVWAAGLAALVVLTAVTSFPGARVHVADTVKTSLVAMTFNVQQFNDAPGEKSIDRQIALIQRASPDILALQETDSNRISLNNNDYVRFMAGKLGYYAYYGPTPVTGTYGTAILSRFPLQESRSVFIYSDKDETGVAEAEIVIAGRRFTIYNVHPDSSDPAMVAFAQIVLARSRDRSNVIVLGDFNLRDDEQAYRLFDAVYTNVWTSIYPGKISKDGVDMSGRNRIDHIFLSPDLTARNPVYVLPPESATDHAVHWTEITW